MNAISAVQRSTFPRDAVRPVVIAAGGTGGHFFPAEALAAALLARGRAVALLTDARSGGLNSAVFAGQPIHVLRGAGIAGRGAIKAIAAAAALALGTLQARTILRRLDAGAVVGFGGYPSVAPVLASRMVAHRMVVILHEQNAVLGRANAFLARRADRLAVSFAETSHVPRATPTTLTGNPVRPAIAAQAGRPYAPPGSGAIRLVVLGGSLGARILSEIVPVALARLPDGVRLRLVVTQQCRAADLPAVAAGYAAAGIEAALSPFFADVAALLAQAHLVIARAGASTVAELAVVGRPAILVPLANAIDDHQSANARAFGSGGWILAQSEFNPDRLAALMLELLADQTRLTEAAAEAASLGRADAASRLADLVEQALADRPA